MAGPETRLVRDIRDRLLRAYPGSWVVKIHGGPYQVAGIPDLIGCVEGRFVGIEVKVPGKEDTLTPRQARTLELLRSARGIAFVATSPKQAVTVLEESLL